MSKIVPVNGKLAFSGLLDTRNGVYSKWDSEQKKVVTTKYPDNDLLYGPYASVDDAFEALSEANTQGIDSLVVGKTVGIIDNGKIVEYWFESACASASDLKKKGSVLTAGNGITIDADTSKIAAKVETGIPTDGTNQKVLVDPTKPASEAVCEGNMYVNIPDANDSTKGLATTQRTKNLEDAVGTVNDLDEALHTIDAEGKDNTNIVRAMNKFYEGDAGEDERDAKYAVAEGTESGSVAGDGSRWGSYRTAEDNRDEFVKDEYEMEVATALPTEGNLVDNTYYKIAGESTSIAITGIPDDDSDDALKRGVVIEFTASATESCQLSYPDGLYWAGSEEPVIEKGYKYQILIIYHNATLTMFGQYNQETAE